MTAGDCRSWRRRSRLRCAAADRPLWTPGLCAAVAWAAAAVVTVGAARRRFRGAATICSPLLVGAGAGSFAALAFVAPAHRPSWRDARLLRPVVHRHRRLVRAVGVDDGQDRLAAEAVLLAADRPAPRLRHRLAASAHLHRLFAAALGARLRSAARSSAMSSASRSAGRSGSPIGACRSSS